MEIRKNLGNIIGGVILSTALAGAGACAGTDAFSGAPAAAPAFKPVDTVEGLVDGYHVSITRHDTNQDKKYDAITVKVRDETENRLIRNFRFVDEDHDELMDKVLEDIYDAEGNLRSNGSSNPDGVYDATVGFEYFFERVLLFERKPTEEEKKVDTVYNEILKTLQ